MGPGALPGCREELTRIWHKVPKFSLQSRSKWLWGVFPKSLATQWESGFFASFGLPIRSRSEASWTGSPTHVGGEGRVCSFHPGTPCLSEIPVFFFAHPSISFPFLGLLGTGFDDDVGFLCRNTNTQLRPPVCSTNVPSCPAKSAGHVLGAGHCDHWFTGGGEREGPTTPLRGEGVRPPPRPGVQGKNQSFSSPALCAGNLCFYHVFLPIW